MTILRFMFDGQVVMTTAWTISPALEGEGVHVTFPRFGLICTTPPIRIPIQQLARVLADQHPPSVVDLWPWQAKDPAHG